MKNAISYHWGVFKKRPIASALLFVVIAWLIFAPGQPPADEVIDTFVVKMANRIEVYRKVFVLLAAVIFLGVVFEPHEWRLRAKP